MRVFLGDSKVEIEIENEPSLGRGGEGGVYRVLRPAEYTSYCVKIYNENKITPEKIRKLEYLLKNSPILDSKGHRSVIWIENLVYRRKDSSRNYVFQGILMPIAEGYPVEYLCAYKFPISRIKPNETTLYTKFDRSHHDSLKTRLAVCYNIAVSVAQLHQKQIYVHGDIKPENIIFNHKGKVSIIDFDTVQVIQNGKLLFPALAHTPEYVPPMYQKSDLKNTLFIPFVDVFSMTVIFYRILMGIHPFASTNFKAPYQNVTDIPTAIQEKLFPFGKKQKYFNQLSPPHHNFKKLPKHIQDLFLEVLENENTAISAVDWMEAINPQKPRLQFPLLPLTKVTYNLPIEDLTTFTFEPNPVLNLPTYIDNQYDKYHWVDEGSLKPSLLDMVFRSQKARAANEIIYLQNACKELISEYKQLKKKHSDMLMHYALQSRNIAQKAQQTYNNLLNQSKDLFFLHLSNENQYQACRDKAYQLLEKWLYQQIQQNPKIKLWYTQYFSEMQKLTQSQSLIRSNHIHDIQQIVQHKKLSFEEAKQEYLKNLSQKYAQQIAAIEEQIQQLRKNIDKQQWETHPWIQAELSKVRIEDSNLPAFIVKQFVKAGFYTAADIVDIDEKGQVLDNQGNFVKIPQIGFTRANEVWTWKNNLLKTLKKEAKKQNIDLNQFDTPEILAKKAEIEVLKNELANLETQIKSYEFKTNSTIEQLTAQFWYQVFKETSTRLEHIIEPAVKEYEKFVREHNPSSTIAQLKAIIDEHNEKQLELKLYYENTHQAYIRKKTEIETKIQENIKQIKELWKCL
ncbi:MAG: protein kinase [Bacteroidia bacterium]|nr:protein kinase [Bacteroidia bacterium]MDW8301604.1 protein kinase [Bacteroidia bacterium]